MVAACVMTFEARDRAAKFMSNQLKIIGGGGGGGVGQGTVAGHRGYGRQTPFGGYLSRGDSGRSSCYQNTCDIARHKMNKSPSAPNLAAANRGPGTGTVVGRLPLRHKHAVHVLSPGGGRALLSPHALRRQAMSMDTQDYSPFFSPPRSRHSSSGLLTSNTNNNNNDNGNIGTNSNNIGGGSKPGSGSGESVNDPRACRGSRGSMVLDLHVPNECPVTMRVRDRSRRSDTARRHVLCRQTPVELDDGIIAYTASATATEQQQRIKRCTRSATCDVPHVVRSKRRRQDSSCSDVIARRRSGSPVCTGGGGNGVGGSGGDGGGGCGGGVGGGCYRGWRSSANDVVDIAEWTRTANRSGSGNCIASGSAVTSPQRNHYRASVHGQSKHITAQNTVDSKMSLSHTCSDIMSIDKSFEESNYSSS